MPNNAFAYFLPQRHISVRSNQDACHSFTFSKITSTASTPPRFKIFCVRYTSATAKTGGASRDRTDDPLLAKQVLSQLSYGPIDGISKLHDAFFKATVLEESGYGWPASCRWIDTQVMVGLGGLEPPASPLSGVRSNHLSYRPIKL